MSILTGPRIRQIVNRTKEFRKQGFPPPIPAIDIEPFDPALCGPNSYDVHLAPELLCYDIEYILDMKKENEANPLTIPEEGLVLIPGILYLGTTVERTWCAGLVPWLDGRSSVGRLGMFLHITAGRGDDNFDGHWTCEISVVQPLRIYPNVRIGQITFLTIDGDRQPYQGQYQKVQTGPVPSGMWRDFLPKLAEPEGK